MLKHFLYVFVLLIHNFNCIPLEKYLLDTTTIPGELNWDKQAFGTSNEIPGWKEQSYSLQNGDVWRVYFVCDIASSSPDNWLRTPFIYRQDGNRLIIRLEYTIRECNRYPGAVRSCKETFQLLYSETNNDTAQEPSFSESNYKFLKTIAPNSQLSSSSSSSSSSQLSSSTTASTVSSNIYRTEVDVSVSSKGVYFVFRDQGACASILSVKVFYRLCSSQVTNLIIYPQTPTGANITDLVPRNGYCADNAESKQTPIAYCQTNGNWFIPNDNDNLCQCKAGYYYSTDNNSVKCLACPQGTYKSSADNTQCLKCPLNSWTPSTAYKSCICNDGYFRPNDSQIDSPCIVMPTEPKNLTVYYVDQATIRLRWNAIDNYEQNTIQYIVNCYKCDKNNSSSSNTLPNSVCSNKVACENFVKYIPDKNLLFNNEVTLSSLDSNTQYYIELYAKHINNLFQTKTIDISISTLRDLQNYELNNYKCVYILETNQYIFYWSFKNSIDRSLIKSYEIRYWPKNQDINMAKIVSVITNLEQLNYTLNNLSLDLRMNYLFQIRMQNIYGWGPYTQQFAVTQQFINTTYQQLNNNLPIIDTTSTSQTDVTEKKTSENITAYIALAVAGSLCFVIGTLTIVLLIARNKVFFCCKGNNGGKIKRNCAVSGGGAASMLGGNNGINSATGIIGSNFSDCDSIDLAKHNAQLAYNQFINGPSSSSGSSTTSTSSSESIGSSPLWPPTNTITTGTLSKTYIDPHTYEDPTKAVNEFATELSPANIIIESVIGGGEFGDVCKGYLKHSPWCQTTVAIKTLKNAATEQNRCDFLTEASIMAQFNDPNVIHLEGVVTKSLPLMIVTEYMENGSLDTFLRLNETKLQLTQLIKMLKDVASGMKYLADMNYIHRDLAARNILVNKDLVCKVADFGLSREIEHDMDHDGVYTTKGGKIPIRWTSPEAILFRKFTWSSDIWSFGVLAWEVLSYGERPYWNWTNQDVLKAIEKCYRLPSPHNCPEYMYDLLLKCWSFDRLKRPKFGDIVIMLDYLIKQPNELTKQAKLREILPINPNKPTYVQMTTTKEFLLQIKLEQYIQYFEKHALNNLSTLFYLQPRDIMYSINITNTADQKLILDSLNSIRNHFSVYYNLNSSSLSSFTSDNDKLMLYYSQQQQQQQQQQFNTLIPITILGHKQQQQQQHQQHQSSIFHLLNTNNRNSLFNPNSEDALILKSSTNNNQLISSTTTASTSSNNSGGYLV